MNFKNTAEYIKENYSIDPKASKWLLKGGDILKYIGLSVVQVNFKKDTKESPWTNTTNIAHIKSISDWDPMTRTYKCVYTLEDDPKEIEKRIIPEGFVFNNPEEDLWAIRFVPYSLHMEMSETEIFYHRLKKLYDEKPTLSITQLTQLRENIEGVQGLNYIAAIINTDKGINCGLCSFRINNISLPSLTKKDNIYTFGIKDSEDNYYSCKWTLTEDTIKLSANGKFIGDLKILDIED